MSCPSSISAPIFPSPDGPVSAMKKKLTIFTAVLLVAALCVGLWFYGYYSRKSNDNIPSKDLMLTYLEEKGEAFATEKLEGYLHTQLAEVWGQPQGQLSGLWGDIWQINDTAAIIAYYDSNGTVVQIKLHLLTN